MYRKYYFIILFFKKFLFLDITIRKRTSQGIPTVPSIILYICKEHTHRKQRERKTHISVFLKQNFGCWEKKRGREREMEIESKFKRICVFCGSSPGNKTSYRDAAIELGTELVNLLFFPFPFFAFLDSVFFIISIFSQNFDL